VSTTLSGWAGIPHATDPRLVWITVPGTHTRLLLRREVAPVFAAALADVNRHVIALDGGPCAGWNYRPARTGAGLSNHAGGVAADVRWDVLKADHRRHMTGAQIAAMHAILNHYVTSRGKRVFGWGGDWKVGAYCDEMHLEVGQAWQPGVGSFVSAADFLDVQHRLRIDATGVARRPAKVPAKVPAAHSVPPFPGTFGQGAHGPAVKALQRGLVHAGFHLTVDGQCGAQTVAALRAWQRKHLTHRATGRVDARTYKALAR
jgi:hypothetical protein